MPDSSFSHLFCQFRVLVNITFSKALNPADDVCKKEVMVGFGLHFDGDLDREVFKLCAVEVQVEVCSLDGVMEGDQHDEIAEHDDQIDGRNNDSEGSATDRNPSPYFEGVVLAEGSVEMHVVVPLVERFLLGVGVVLGVELERAEGLPVAPAL